MDTPPSGQVTPTSDVTPPAVTPAAPSMMGMHIALVLGGAAVGAGAVWLLVAKPANDKLEKLWWSTGG